MSNIRMNGAGAPVASDVGALAIPENVDIVVGTTATFLKRPKGATLLTMKCTAGSFLVEQGDVADAFPAQPSTTTVETDDGDENYGLGAGTALWPLEAGEGYPIAASNGVTVLGADAGSKLFFFWS